MIYPIFFLEKSATMCCEDLRLCYHITKLDQLQGMNRGALCQADRRRRTARRISTVLLFLRGTCLKNAVQCQAVRRRGLGRALMTMHFLPCIQDQQCQFRGHAGTASSCREDIHGSTSISQSHNRRKKMARCQPAKFELVRPNPRF
jgi:hypothetical protein